MSSWLDPEGRCFNPRARFDAVALMPGRPCLVVDDALANPEGLRQWAARQRYAAPAGFPYPGRVCAAPPEFVPRFGDFFAQHVRGRLGARRTLELTLRLSVIHQPPEALAPVQWLCHRDRLEADPGDTLIAAGVLYLFDDPALGGTSFYRPRLPPEQTDRLVADSCALDAQAFGARYGLQPGYMAGDNAYFERIARVDAAWNRAIFYDGSVFHSADVAADPARLLSDPLRGRLTLNCFITCRRQAA